MAGKFRLPTKIRIIESDFLQTGKSKNEKTNQFCYFILIIDKEDRKYR